MGNFNINLLNNCNIDKNTSDYVVILYSHAFFPTINLPTRITPNSKTLIDNIFYNDVTKNIICKDIFACLFSIHSAISLSRHEQVCQSKLRFKRYFSHHRAFFFFFFFFFAFFFFFYFFFCFFFFLYS